jgi:hypothetical protein
MDRRVFHGSITPTMVAQALVAEFNHGNIQTQVVGVKENLTVQVASPAYLPSGGRTAVTVNVQQVEDGVMVQVGDQQWFGVAASLGQTAISTLLNPLNLLGRLDDIAQDVSSLQLKEKIWQVVSDVTRAAGAGKELSTRLSRIICDYCTVANHVGAATCIACGAPLGNKQPRTCMNCGFVLARDERTCPNCRQAL